MELRVNGELRRVDVDPRRSLLSVLRDDLGLTGCKYGCGEAQCGSCTVLLDGAPVNSCVTTMSSVGDQEVRTVESLADGDTLHPVQEAFIETGAMQCGYCITGMIMSAVALLESDPDPSEATITRHLDGNVCRCGVYPRIVRAVQRAARVMRGGDR